MAFSHDLGRWWMDDKKQAMERFGMTESDVVIKANVQSLIENAERFLNTHSLPKPMRIKVEMDIEAYKALID